jgi:hypothetical protein
MERSQPGQVIGYTSSKNLERVVSREFSNIHHQVQAVAYFAWTRKIDCPFHASLAPNLTYKRSIPKMKQPHDLASKESNKRLCHNPIFWWFGLWCTPLSKNSVRGGPLSCGYAHGLPVSVRSRHYWCFFFSFEDYRNPIPILNSRTQGRIWLLSARRSSPLIWKMTRVCGAASQFQFAKSWTTP